MKNLQETKQDEFETLLVRALEGSRAAKEDLARICLRRARRSVFLSTGGSQDTDDLVQRILLKVFSGLHTYRREAKFTSWFDAITFNTLKDHYRRKKVIFLFSRGETNEMVSPLHRGLVVFDAYLDVAQAVRALAEHLEKISPLKRMAFVLHAAHGYTSAEISRIVGCTPEAAKKRIAHGRKELLSRVQKDKKLLEKLEEVIA